MTGTQTFHSSPNSTGVYEYKPLDEKNCISDINEIYSIAKSIYHKKTSAQIIDARPPSTFDSGHITGALNLPFQNLLNEDGTMKPSEELA